MDTTHERLHALADNMLGDRRIKRVSVASIAKVARISRSAIYKYPPDVVEKLRRATGGSRKKKRESLLLKIHLLRERVAKVESLNAALVKTCAELLAQRSDDRQLDADRREADARRIAFLEAKLKGQANVRALK